MAYVYITDQTRKILDQLSESENRKPSNEIDFLCEKRVKELGLPDVSLSSSDNGIVPNQKQESQSGK